VVANYGTSFNEENYGATGSPLAAQYFYCCTSPTKSGNGNINVSSQFLDSVCHIPTTLACYGAGSALYSVGNDLDGEPWNNPPSIGCDEIILSNLIGPLSAYITSDRTNLLVNHFTGISGRLTGKASRVEWSFADGPIITNLGAAASHRWTDVGDYNVQLTAFNSDYTNGVTTNLLIHVLPINSPPLENAQISSNQFMFQFQGQVDASYTVQYTTNLSPPVSWQQFQFFLPSTGQVYQIKDPAITNGRRFFRVWAQ
jgi:PKD repeat protein